MARPVVLIVEDEGLTRIDAADIVTAGGFEVIQAANADEAIRILESRDDICIVFTDVHMPGSMDGLKLANAVRNRWPPIRIVVTSGRVRLGPDDIPTGARFLPKPYAARDVVRTFQELTA
jgi:CheY-like chemotaxis protein